jgi:energy-coupling factor transporter transmembrane protein EcfT
VHPVIRIANFFIIVAGLTVSSRWIFFIAMPILFLLIRTGCTFLSLFILLKRLRWLFLSLLILHLWFSTGQLVWIPEISTIFIAVERIGALILIVLVAHLLVKTTSISAIIAALQWWLMPLKRVGFPSEKLTVRLALILDIIDSVQKIQISSESRDTLNPLQKIVHKITVLFIRVFEQAENAPLFQLDILPLHSPPFWQWIYPLILLVIIKELT